MSNRGSLYSFPGSAAHAVVESPSEGPQIRGSKIRGMGAMAELVRSHDWANTPLGRIEDWPETLLTTVNTILESRIPMAVSWGPEMIQIYNDAYVALIGEKHPEALGAHAAETWREAWHRIGPQFEAALVHGEATEQESVPVPTLCAGRLEDVYWSCSTSPVRTPTGAIAGLLTVCVDTTGERLARRDRRQIAEQLDQVMDATTDGVASLDSQYRFVYLNRRAREILAPQETVLGRSMWECFPQMVYANSPYVENCRRAMEDGKAGAFEAYYPEPLNIWMQVNTRPAKDGMVIYFRDITWKKHAESSLKETEKLAAVGRLAASIAHEINSPLEAVTNLLYLAMQSGNMSELRGYLQTAERELERVSAISNETLRFNRQSSNPRAVDCDELVESALYIHHRRLVNSHIEVEQRLKAQRPLNCFDGEIRQVLNNLIGNAIDAMKAEGGRLLVRSREATHWPTRRKGLVLTVADTGGGIRPELLRKIFEPFFTTKGSSGTGLGLWVSQEIAHRHEGQLRVRSRQGRAKGGEKRFGVCNGGTVFTLFLPFEAALRSAA
jgi:PAS domain S-box-containing protein